MLYVLRKSLASDSTCSYVRETPLDRAPKPESQATANANFRFKQVHHARSLCHLWSASDWCVVDVIPTWKPRGISSSLSCFATLSDNGIAWVFTVERISPVSNCVVGIWSGLATVLTSVGALDRLLVARSFQQALIWWNWTRNDWDMTISVFPHTLHGGS